MIRVVLPAGLLLLAWLLAGRQITLFMDRVMPIPAASLAVSPLAYNGGGFVIGGIQLSFGATDNLRAPLDLTFDPANRVILSWGHDSFVLGPRHGPGDPSGRTDFVFDAEPGDEVSFTRRQSLVSWPTPFEIRFMGGPPPKWHRNVYYRLIWKKLSGAKLEMRWRYQQDYHSARGWTEPLMMWNSQTGLLSVAMQPESAGMEGAVVRYIARVKGWNRRDYRIEQRGRSSDGRSEIFAAVHRDDERSCAPGAGRSVELYVDPVSGQVIKETGGQ